MFSITSHQDNANPNHFTPIRMAIIKKKKKNEQKITSVGKDAEKLETLHIPGGNAKWYSHCGKLCGNSSKKSSLELPYDPAILLL